MHEKNSRPNEATAVPWAVALGEARHVRDESTSRAAKSKEEDDTRTIAISAERWRTIIAAMRQLTDSYNTGVRRVVLDFVEQSGPSAVTITTGGEGTPSLTAALEGELICIQARDVGGDPYASEIRLCSDRDDAATAAYILRNWMQRL
jgi:hypothetical protein